MTTVAQAFPTATPPLMSVSRTGEILNVSRSTAYDLARTGQLPGVTKLGSRFVVRTSLLTRWLDGQPDAQ